MKISSRSYILDREHILDSNNKRKWSALSIAVVTLTGLQVSGWNTLIQPTVIIKETPLNGQELDLSSRLLQQLQTNGALNSCVFNSIHPGLSVAFATGQTESGYASAKDYLDSGPGSLTLMDQTFNTSTGGILPLTLFDVDATGWFPDFNITAIPAAISASSAILSNGLPSSYSMNQQGFTADVQCKFQTLAADTTPSLFLATNAVTDSANPNITNFEISSDCIVADASPDPDGSQLNVAAAYVQVVPPRDPDYVLMIGCGGVGNDYIFVGSGLYAFMNSTVCTFSPKITRVQVDYSDADSFSGTIGTTTFFSGAISDSGGPSGLSAVATIKTMISFAQALNINTMGNQLRGLLQDLDTSSETMLSATANYIRGVAEYSGSVFRACLSMENGTLVDGVPANMTTPIYGSFRSQGVGWQDSARSRFLPTFLPLVPGTIVAIATIVVALVTVARHARDPVRESFDPSDTMHLLFASAAGGLNNVFSGTIKDAIVAAEDVHIVLGNYQGRIPAFTHS
ncbi:hypothetical protein DFH08DRAFT_958986 [Mycena albidolilacea]|uniref:Uncharacterized protein n=1 Tax=Mycena albidolilacea TaxID=1033008 RepID=A0AAD7A6N6_9AGAR|nr:hypothetical protein DFH08DRAFT_958986 [Mycena albidolilacea]